MKYTVSILILPVYYMVSIGKVILATKYMYIYNILSLYVSTYT